MESSSSSSSSSSGSSNGDLMDYQPFPITNPNDQRFWMKAYDLFEDHYRTVMCHEESTIKRKIHIDNCQLETSHIHEPQMKWCPILFLDAVVHVAMNHEFNAKTQACVDRRQFNQHKTLRQCIERATDIEILATTTAQLPQNVIPSALKARSGSTTDEREMDNVQIGNNKKRSFQSFTNNALDHMFGEDRTDVNDNNKTSLMSNEEKGAVGLPGARKTSKQSDNWSYRTWLNCWGSFEKLNVCVDTFAGKDLIGYVLDSLYLFLYISIYCLVTIHLYPTLIIV